MKKVPPGQRFIPKWPVRSVESMPEIDPETWTLTIKGLVKAPRSLSFPEIRSLPAVEIRRDFHCVETWSVPDNTWKGVRVRDIVAPDELLEMARYAVIHSHGGYTSEVDVACLMAEDTLLAWERNGEPIPPEHGYPLRLIVPDRYAYKSVKWVTAIEFVDRDIPGYWEERGYHTVADVWRSERFG